MRAASLRAIGVGDASGDCEDVGIDCRSVMHGARQPAHGGASSHDQLVTAHSVSLLPLSGRDEYVCNGRPNWGNFRAISTSGECFGRVHTPRPAMMSGLVSLLAMALTPPRGGVVRMGASAVQPRGPPPRRLVSVDLGDGKSVGVVAAWPVWPASQALARVMAHAPSICKGRRVLELGCGLGAIGLAAAASGATEVLLTDAEQAFLECASDAAAATGLAGSISTRVFDWAHKDQGVDDIVDQDEPFDLVVAADVLYDSAAPELVASLVDKLLRTPGAKALIADPVQRTYRTAFDIACSSRGLKLDAGPLPGPDSMRLLSVTRAAHA